MRSVAALVFPVVLAVVFIGPALAAETDGHTITLTGVGACPTRDTFVASLRAIFPDVVVNEQAEEGSTAVVLSDDGDRYRVLAGAYARDFLDADGACEERAKKAAVFVALVLQSPELVQPEVPTEPVVAGPGSLPVATPPVVRRALSAQLDIGALFDGAPRRDANSLYAGGLLVRAWVGGRWFGAVLGAEVLSPTTLELPDARARLWRVPLDVGLRGRWRRGALALVVDAELVLAAQVTQGVATPESVTASRLAVGFRASAKAEWWVARRFAPFVAFQVEAVPSAYHLVIGNTVEGSTPRVWLSAVLGVAVDLLRGPVKHF